MKNKCVLHCFAIIGLTVFITFALASATQPTSQVESQRQTEEQAEIERMAKEQADRERIARVQAERERQERGYISLVSEIPGHVLVNGEDTEFRSIPGTTFILPIENAAGKTITVAVRDNSGALFEAEPVTITVTGSINSKPILSYGVIILNPDAKPNSQEDFTVSQNTGGGITITDYKGTRNQVIIPDTLYGQKVTEIGIKAFAQDGFTHHNDKEKIIGIISVVIPETVVKVGDGAFECNWRLTKLVIPDSVTEIGDSAFKDCGLTMVTLGRRIRRIGKWAFMGNYLEFLAVMSSFSDYRREIESFNRYNGSPYYRVVSGIGEDAFSRGSLSLSLPENMPNGENISKAFFSRRPLSKVNLPANMHDENIKVLVPSGLAGFYIGQGKRAGTYVLNGPVWERE